MRTTSVALAVLCLLGLSGTASANDAPFVQFQIPNQTATAGTAFAFTFASNTFQDPEGDALYYEAALNVTDPFGEYLPLPTWLTFQSSTRSFSGTPTNADAGVIHVRVTATDGEGLSTWDVFAITVTAVPNTPPVADAGADQSVFVGYSVSLYGSATDADGDTITAWEWTVVSSTTDDLVLDRDYTPTVSVDANGVGTMVLSLRVYDGTDWSLPDTVTVTAVVNQPPVAVIVASTLEGDAPLTVNFDGRGSYDPEGETLSFAWSFGTGNRAFTSTAQETFQAAGEYLVALRVTDDKGQIGTDSVIITVNPASNDAPVASPEADPQSGTAPLYVAFAANASDADGDTLTYAWNFGDGSTSTNENPTHTFTSAGTYTVSLTVSDGSDSVTETLTVVATPDALLSCESVRVKWRSNREVEANVWITGDLFAEEPDDTDEISVTLDGVELVSAFFGDFDYEDGIYKLRASDVLVDLDFTNGTIQVHRRKVVMLGFDPDNGAEVVVTLGAAHAVDTVELEERGNGGLLVYDGR